MTPPVRTARRTRGPSSRLQQRALALRLLALAMLPLLACAAPWRGEQATPTPALPATSAPAPLATPVSAALGDSANDAVPLLPAPAPAPFTEVMAQAPDSFNPVLTTNRTALTLQRLFLPSLVSLDPQSGAVRPALAESWVWAPDNRTLTMTVAGGLAWSDGMPLTSRDAAFTLLAAGAPTAQSPWTAHFAAIESITLPEPDTLVIHQRSPDCALLSQLTLPLLPSHLFAADFSDLRSADWNGAPAVGAGPFLFAGGAPGAEVRLEPNAQWRSAPPLVNPLLIRFEPDPARRLQLASSGAAQRVWELPPESLSALAGMEQRQVMVDGMSMLVMNLADPIDPQPGIAPNGVLQPQAPHPLLADLTLREAIARAVDWPRLVREAYGAVALPQFAWLPPALGWAHDPTVTLPTFDPAAAATLLEQAGWSDAAGNGQRERGGQLLQLTLMTNDDNPQRVALAQAAAVQLRSAGFDLRVELLPFAAARQAVLAQRYDLAIVGWEELGPDPAGLDFWHSSGDLPGSGPNLTSYQNPALDALLDEARTLPGCNEASRADRYRAVQQILAAELPAIPLNTQSIWFAVESGWSGIPASVWAPHAGIERWLPPAPDVP